MLRLKYVALAAAATAALCMAASPSMAQSGVTKDELKCESGAGKTLSKFVGSKGKCVSKCLATQRKATTPAYAGCFAPYADTATQACINDPVKGAEAKARAGIVKGCTKDCPECYTDQSPTLCSTGEPFVGTTETNVDTFNGLIYCLENMGTTPTKDQAKCEDGLSKALIKFVGAKAKCYDKCNQNVFKGKAAEGSCTPPPGPPPFDAPTKACIDKASASAAAAIDKVCSAVPGATPACSLFTTGAGWVNLTEGAIDAVTSQVACGSPSGAFLN